MANIYRFFNTYVSISMTFPNVRSKGHTCPAAVIHSGANVPTSGLAWADQAPLPSWSGRGDSAPPPGAGPAHPSPSLCSSFRSTDELQKSSESETEEQICHRSRGDLCNYGHRTWKLLRR